ncbi:GNAT family N-acetyltransferase [Actinospica robiniae]|uniref:GNAT family N-acetyltransferase n=1 Tax=Actinospica robiniae TaxID=304901 RepID=UPI0003FEB799|nr:GNAT family N-acetyltransferase [Actinospica robiniae]
MAPESTAEQQSPHTGGAFVRRYRDQDAEAVADICLRTADAGRDATGIYQDPAILDHLFAAPYIALDPELAFVLDDGEGRAVGYVLGTDDTHRFADRFRDEWLPRVAGRHAAAPVGDWDGPDELMAWLLHNPDRLKVAGLEAYPGHLHIDLLPSHQRQGHGSTLLARLVRELAERSTPALHVGMLTTNTAARKFYDRLGFHVIPIEDPALTYLGLAVS